MYTNRRSSKEIDDQLNTAAYFFDRGTKYPGMTYDEGVQADITWVLGDADDMPYDNEDVNAANKAEV